MKNAVSVVKYGIDTLKVSPDKMFSLLESSKGYEGEDYQRWLAGKMIEVLEKRNFGYSQLMVKKFDIIQSIIEEYSESATLSKIYLDKFLSTLNREVVYSTSNFEEAGELVDVDWFNGIDFDEVNSGFVAEVLPEKVQNNLLNKESFALVTRLSDAPSDKKSELYLDSKQRGIVCKNQGSLMLYRMCSLVNAFESHVENFKFGFLVKAEYLYDADNKDILKYFLSYFKYEGFAVKAGDLFENSFENGKYAFIVATPRKIGDAIQDGIVLKDLRCSEGVLEEGSAKRYSSSDNNMLNKIIKESKMLTDSVVIEEGGKPVGLGRGLKEALGYLQYEGALTLSSNPVKGKKNVAITKDNLEDIIVCYSVSKSMECFGLFSGIKEVISGHKNYKQLFYNCIPLFLFDPDTKFADLGLVRSKGEQHRLKNQFDVLTSEIIADLLDKGEVYFSYEAKELFNISKGFLDFSEKESPNSTQGKTFAQIRAEAEHNDLNKFYMTALINMKDYISSIYRKMM